MADLLQDHIHSPDPYDDDDGPPPASRMRIQFKRELAGMSMDEQQSMLSPESGEVPGIQFLMDPEAVQFEKGPPLGQPIDAAPFKALAQICLAISPETVGDYQSDLESWIAMAGVPGSKGGAAAKALALILKKVNPDTVGIYGPMVDNWAAQATGTDLSATFPILGQALKNANPEMLPLYGPLIDQWVMGMALDPAAVAAAPPEPLDFGGLLPAPDAVIGGAPSHILAIGSLIKKANPDIAAGIDEWMSAGDATVEGLVPVLKSQKGASGPLNAWLEGGADPIALLTALGEVFPDIAPDLDLLMQHMMLTQTVAGPAALDPVQYSGAGGADTSAIHAAAAEGTKGGGGALPHMDKIQSSFGKYDVGGVKAYTGGDAAKANTQMGSLAYASGNKIAFKSAPDVHTAAHEAAHIVQQAAGVSLPGGVGSVGDKYEKHADAVADKVVSGQSAESALDSMTGGGSAAGVQKLVQHQREHSLLQHEKESDSEDEDPHIADEEAVEASAEMGDEDQEALAAESSEEEEVQGIFLGGGSVQYAGTTPPASGGTSSGGAAGGTAEVEKQLGQRYKAMCQEKVQPNAESVSGFNSKASKLAAEFAKIKKPQDGSTRTRASVVKSWIKTCGAFSKLIGDASKQTLDDAATYKASVTAAVGLIGKTAAFAPLKTPYGALSGALTAIAARDKLSLDDASKASKFTGYVEPLAAVGLSKMSQGCTEIATALTDAGKLVTAALTVEPEGLTKIKSGAMDLRPSTTKLGLKCLGEGVGDLDGCAAAYTSVIAAYDSANVESLVTAEAVLGGAFTIIEAEEPGARFLGPGLTPYRQAQFQKNRDLVKAADEALKPLEEAAKNKATTGESFVALRETANTAITAVPSAFGKIPTWLKGRVEVALKIFNKTLDDHVAEVIKGLEEIDVNMWTIQDVEKGQKLAKDGNWAELDAHLQKVKGQKLDADEVKRRTEESQTRVRQKHVSAGAGVAGGMLGGPLGAAGGRAAAGGAMGGEAAYHRAKAEGSETPVWDAFKAAWKAAAKGIPPGLALADLNSFEQAVQKKEADANKALEDQRKQLSDLEKVYSGVPELVPTSKLADKLKELEKKEEELKKSRTEVTAKVSAAITTVGAVTAVGLA